MTPVHTIISGGQTGSDRGGLDAARILGLKRGGWAPLGWRAEDGEIPLRYREGMMQSASAAYPVRTRANVEASGGTLILSLGPLPNESGSMLTAKIARQLGKPLISTQLGDHGMELTTFEVDHFRSWLVHHRIATLNVAGPRESREPGIQAATCAALVAILGGAPMDAGFGG